jgi:hypothetical protein
MTTWLLRGLLFGIGMVLLRLVQGGLINANPTKAGVISVALVVIFGIAAFLSGLFDGTADARANHDPDRRRDMAMFWLLAGLVAGVFSGLLTWIISQFYGGVYADRLWPELVVFPAFTALLIFLPAMFAVALGRYLVDRRRPVEPRRHRGSDVFDSIHGDDNPTSDGDASGEDNTRARSASLLTAPTLIERDFREEAREAVRAKHQEGEQQEAQHRLRES